MFSLEHILSSFTLLSTGLVHIIGKIRKRGTGALNAKCRKINRDILAFLETPLLHGIVIKC